ncbi:Deoxyribonucleoside regulator [Actinomyces bovis]|uniref:Deoxyribonucleoside regulator n=1 Tax=Actinomyces bovis TaxID=1658 RepID=A0ABY1VLM7_9ACTO|nr:sugar-binding domain-containing protein [Actinomyces bovis]SPT52718.1 Deoxyribonucleoside regulator [Actinomyces bovis]VEG54680.1 Deoxyribonucleoside regulator [Actinomyces israelii]
MDKRDEQALTAVRLYFERGLSQAEVATAMGLSRPTVAKLIQHGKDAGYVTVVINDPRETSSELARKLQERFGLEEVRVVHAPISNDAELLEGLGRVGAELVNDIVKDGMSVGVSWGRTMSAIAAQLRHTTRRDVRIVQLKGGCSYSEQANDDYEVMRAFCDAFNAAALYLPLPVVFQDVTTLRIVERDPHIAAILQAGRNTDAVVFTVGAVNQESLLHSHNQLSQADRKALLGHAVGDACSRFFTADGAVAAPEVDERTVGTTLADLASRPVRALIAGGQGKARALSTALQMGLATHLVVDQKLTLTLLNEEAPAT